jgi:D-alanyl-D-alanine dipeptidase
MNTKEYCRSVEQKERLHRQLSAAQSIRDDQSPLVSLQESGFNLMFEPSMMDGYAYRVREAVHEKIGRIGQSLAEQDKVLIIRSAWRSFEHQRRLWENKFAVMQQKYPHRTAAEVKEIVSHFIAPPSKSMHATGGAVDALIYDVKNDCVMDFGNNEGLKLELDETAYPDHPGISSQAQQNRQLLIRLFEEEDFVVDILEYWHFDYGNAGWAAVKGQEYARYGVIEELVNG